MSYAFQAEGLVKRFGETTALAGIDLAAHSGTVFGVLGPNGAGKTTAVRILATLLQLDAGRATVGGYDVVGDAPRVRELIGLTGQYASVDEDLTGHENLVLIGQLLNLRRRDAKTRATQMLQSFELGAAAQRKVAAYSGGMRRRLDLAASLMGDPAVIFLDEPTTGLDPGKRGEVWRMIRSMTDGGGTVLLTTQYLEEADALADDIVVIDHGKVIAEGTPSELKTVVGGQTLDVRPEDATRVEEVAAIVGAVAGRTAETRSREIVTAQVDGDAPLHETVQRLEAAGIGVTELALRQPSLDEVFFALTGHHAAPNDPEDGEEAA